MNNREEKLKRKIKRDAMKKEALGLGVGWNFVWGAEWVRHKNHLRSRWQSSPTQTAGQKRESVGFLIKTENV